MPIDKRALVNLKKFAAVFKGARDRNASEADTVTYLDGFFKEVLGYDPLVGEIRKEIQVEDGYCDIAIVLDGKPNQECTPEFLVEAKSAEHKKLTVKNIAQAESYASHFPVNWVLLTNGIDWQLYHLTFGNGIDRDLVFELNFLEEMEKNNVDSVWDKLSILAKENVKDGSLETYYEQKQLLSPKNIVDILLGEEVLAKVRWKLNRKASERLEIKVVFDAVLHVLTPEAAGADRKPPMKKKKHKRRQASESEQSEMPTPVTTPKTQTQMATEEEIPA